MRSGLLSKIQCERLGRAPDCDLVGMASVVLDSLLEGREVDASIQELAWNGLGNIFDRAVQIFLKIARQTTTARVWLGSGRAWHKRYGAVCKYTGYEHHYLCIFCGENLGTFSSYASNVVSSEISDRWKRHTTKCACRMILDLDEFYKENNE